MFYCWEYFRDRYVGSLKTKWSKVIINGSRGADTFKELNNLFLYPNIPIGNQLLYVCVRRIWELSRGGMCCLPLAPTWEALCIRSILKTLRSDFVHRSLHWITPAKIAMVLSCQIFTQPISTITCEMANHFETLSFLRFQDTKHNWFFSYFIGCFFFNLLCLIAFLWPLKWSLIPETLFFTLYT